MSDISFAAEGVSLEMNYLECDSNDQGSSRWSVKLTLSHFTGCFTYEATDIWFEASMWDLFVAGLSSSRAQNLKFFDMSQYFIFSIERTATCFEIEIQAYEPLNSNGLMRLGAQLKSGLDGTFVSKLGDAFMEFPRFW
ncbi:hypothetical protein [Agrobacterium sp. NPDC090283]|uniref:hypothetical protein n=1 Tax=Agrobacterium sp. NPDC090283 TaxID=3363920 RepID=UPI00383A2CCF